MFYSWKKRYNFLPSWNLRAFLRAFLCIERSLLAFSTLFLLFNEYLSKTFDRLEGGKLTGQWLILSKRFLFLWAGVIFSSFMNDKSFYASKVFLNWWNKNSTFINTQQSQHLIWQFLKVCQNLVMPFSCSDVWIISLTSMVFQDPKLKVWVTKRHHEILT